MQSIFRINFALSIQNSLGMFAREHHQLERKMFNVEWKKWIVSSRVQIIAEHQRLAGQGFIGTVDDVIAKMFISVRFHHQKQIIRELIVETTIPIADKSKKTRQVYAQMCRPFLELVDVDVTLPTNQGIRPAILVLAFLDTHFPDGIIQLPGEPTCRKLTWLKKVYQNRYYIHHKKSV